LAFLRAVDAAEEDTFRVLVVEDFDGIAVEDGNGEGEKSAGQQRLFLLEGGLRGILRGMKRRNSSLITVLLGSVMLAYLIVRWNYPINVADIWSRDNQVRNTRRDVGKTPDVKAIPKDILELRQKHQLRPLTELEEGAKIQNLPNGIYGFSTCSVILVSAKRGDTFPLEIHKHDDGIVYYVGYASDEHIGKYLTREKKFHILMSPDSSERTPSLFEIPVEFVSKCEARPSRNGYLFDLFITAIPELQT
jgi:hypothetical protein